MSWFKEYGGCIVYPLTVAVIGIGVNHLGVWVDRDIATKNCASALYPETIREEWCRHLDELPDHASAWNFVPFANLLRLPSGDELPFSVEKKGRSADSIEVRIIDNR